VRNIMKILAIETSADDTGLSVIETRGAWGTPQFSCTLLADLRATQTSHAAYGGIFPTVAKREHAEALPRLFEQIRSMLHVSISIDAVAVTVGPGIEPCLWQGIEFAKKIAAEMSTPVIPIHHMEGHILMSLYREGTVPKLRFPAIVLLVSGGHTELIHMPDWGVYTYLGRTRDDAVGEAFDKVARMLDLPYPGGPHVSRLAERARLERLTAPVVLPRPMIHDKSYDFSFAGLKTAVLRYIEGHPLGSLDRERIAREFEDAVSDCLVYKTRRALEEYGAETLIVGGGVSANSHLRHTLTAACEKTGTDIFLCNPKDAGDNALMIALAGAFRAERNVPVDPESLTANGKMKLC
jgi:N6-L-threonylcarbamoyladenine synthase